jgi:hypothetical protein
MTSWFVAELDCPECGAPTPADTSTEMITSLEPWPQRDVIRVGDDIGTVWDDVARAYLPLREPAADEPIRILQSWWCVARGTLHWAVVAIAAGRVESIAAVPLDAKAVAGSHAIDDQIADRYFELTGEPLFVDGRARAGFGERLRKALAG